jgi:hypothetical protein
VKLKVLSVLSFTFFLCVTFEHCTDLFPRLPSFFSSIPSQYVSPLSSEDGGPHSYQHEGEVVIIVPPLNASLDDDQEQGSPKTTESTSKYRIQHILLEQAY